MLCREDSPRRIRHAAMQRLLLPASLVLSMVALALAVTSRGAPEAPPPPLPTSR